MPKARTVMFQPGMRDGKWPSAYAISERDADIKVARGHATWAADGTRRIVERSISARGLKREWRKTPSAGYSVMQLVPPGEPRHKPARAGICAHP